MLEEIIELLNASEVSDYDIVEKNNISHQAYFVKQKLDQHRISTVQHVTLTVYMDQEVEGKKLRGSAKKEIYQGETTEEIQNDINDLKKNALLAPSEYFELVSDVKANEPKEDTDLVGLLQTAVQAIQNIKDTDTESVNSYEVFVNETSYHVVNSQGVDISFSSIDEEIEIVINSFDGHHEIEIYHDTRFANTPLEEITKEIEDVFKMAKDRTAAVPTKKSDGMTVLLSGQDKISFLSYFVRRTSTSSIYNRMSNVKVGDVIQTGDDCDKITLEIKKEIPGSSHNMPYSLDGLKAKDVTIINEGKYENLWGDAKTAYYLGIKDVAPGNNFEVKGGSLTREELTAEPYLEILETSGLVMNPMTGNFSGEIRLGYYFDGEKTVPVTTGSITGNINKVLNTIRFSKEQEQIDYCVMPKTIKLEGIAVAGE